MLKIPDLHFGGSRGLQKVLKNSRICISEGAGGFSPLNKSNEFKGLYPRACFLEWQSNPFLYPR